MSLNIWYLLGVLLLTAFGYCETSGVCRYRLKLKPDKTLRIVSPNYPDRYPSSSECQWHITSDTRIRLTCEKFDIPSSPNCERDIFTVRASVWVPAFSYCKRRDSIFSIESEGSEMTITLKTDKYSPGGLVNCYAEAFKDDYSCKCGRKSSPRRRLPSNSPFLIEGGTETRINEYSMMAAIVDTRPSILKIVSFGGTIISKKHVLTAAHGVVNFYPDYAGVSVGDHDITRSDETAEPARIYKVLKFYPHPLVKNTDHKYDIAIVLTETMTFSNTVGPACLPFNLRPERFEGSPVEILGWGTDQFAGRLSDTLKKARLVVQNFTHCKAHYPKSDRSQMCTFSEHADSCQHDSGGPVLWQHPGTGRLVVIGIISYGTFCSNGVPSINTFVGAYLDWIQEMTSDVKYCKNY